MKFEKGKSGNPAGRPPGSKNRASEEVRKLIETIFSENADALRKDFKRLRGREKIRAMVELLPYLVPKLQAGSFELENLPTEQLEEVLNQLANKIMNNEKAADQK